jgi:flavin reductase (DIM6/NTAB) family NADH-FMN oxidoreductase RutF
MDMTAASTLFAWLEREVWLLTAQAGARRSGLIATFVSPASIVPELPRVLVALSKEHFTHQLVAASGAFALHLLAEEQLELVWRFGLESGRDQDKLAGLEVTTSVTGSPLLAETIGWLDCRVETKLDIGDRVLYLAEVLDGKVTHFAPPLTTKRMMERIPSPRLTQMQRLRQHDSVRDALAIEAWRRRHAADAGGANEGRTVERTTLPSARPSRPG